MKLLLYPNCSNGGVTAVIRSRANADKENTYLVVFTNDRGGRHSFDDLDNVTVRIVPDFRLGAFLTYLFNEYVFDSINVFSMPKIVEQMVQRDELAVTYEFHSSNMSIVEKEISQLPLDRVASLVVPSQEMKSKLSERLPKRLLPRLQVVPNLVDEFVFNTNGRSDRLSSLEEGLIPLVWIGRLEASKGAHFVPRVLAQLPENYVAIMIVSLESDPTRFDRFLAECDSMGVAHRCHILMDLQQQTVAEFYRSAAARGGWLISTSLMESFGYAVSEAISCGLRVAAFELPVWSRFEEEPKLVQVDAGSVVQMASAVAGKVS
ncbi:glycosyltransferase [Corynebacterium sp. ED61]|uniref:glycosyltransferase n=1 Tax=Corynebacterium sp. ED61 TaxID=2211360 RepID=UPI001883BABD|nr:glycosyltransferase [Corynebacterium sp. ED61]MBF0580788.1 glycosyltransferase family 4 protein [Corynebacterium sp. ED61]